jgi:hypothetical protein
MSDEIKLPNPPWLADDTEKWLTLNPLPIDFYWPHRDPLPDGTVNMQPVLPTYRLHKGYGFWLRTTPYFPGLFEEAHAVILSLGDELPSPESLAAQLKTRLMLRGTQLKIFN